MSNLSSLQQYILTWLINHIPVGRDDRQLFERGIDWMPEWIPKTTDQTEDRRLENVWRASLCRSLARLERRGLVQCIRGRKQARTARVRLIDEGHRIAETIAGKLPPTWQ
jgi:DNA-binding MarR family transcriptional regulator